MTLKIFRVVTLLLLYSMSMDVRRGMPKAPVDFEISYFSINFLVGKFFLLVSSS